MHGQPILRKMDQVNVRARRTGIKLGLEVDGPLDKLDVLGRMLLELRVMMFGHQLFFNGEVFLRMINDLAQQLATDSLVTALFYIIRQLTEKMNQSLVVGIQDSMSGCQRFIPGNPFHIVDSKLGGGP